MDMIIILLGHWFADFFMQNDDEATHKSKSIKWLIAHSLKYTFWLTVIICPLLKVSDPCSFIIINGISHGFIDFFSSRINAHFWYKEERHWFFTCIGFDQFLHYAILFWSLGLLK